VSVQCDLLEVTLHVWLLVVFPSVRMSGSYFEQAGSERQAYQVGLDSQAM